MLDAIELFAGAGGLALGLSRAGFSTKGLVEVDKHACATLRKNAADPTSEAAEWVVHESYVSDVDYTPYTGVTLVAGGVPCQPFSLGGTHKGFEDARNGFPEFTHAVRSLNPAVFLVENVKGLLRSKFRPYFEYVLDQLRVPSLRQLPGEPWSAHAGRLTKHIDEAGVEYAVQYALLNAADYGVPQQRERVFIVGLKQDLGVTWEPPIPTHSKTGGKGLKPWVPCAIVIHPHTNPLDPLLDKERMGARVYTGHTGSAVTKPAKTIKSGVHGVPGGENMFVFADGSVRYMTIREAARLQTFPPGWVFSGSWSNIMHQIGNAVPVDLAEIVGASISALLPATSI